MARPVTPVPARAPFHLRTEYQIDPLGLDETEPRLSFLVADDRRGATLTAYQILAASSGDLLAADQGDLWDSGRVTATEPIGVVYAGRPLASFDRVHWKVRTWDADGEVSPWSSEARFELGPLTADDWAGAGFIGSPAPVDPDEGGPAPYLRKSFIVPEAVASARLYVTALGLYEASLNGRPVTDAAFRPGWTDYRVRLPYQAYDVTALLRPGENVIGAILGDGWYCGTVVQRRRVWGDRPALLAVLVVEAADGTRVPVVVTDGSWRTCPSPILRSDHYHGEHYDARRELAGWDVPGFDDAGWAHATPGAEPASSPPRAIVATVAPPVRRTQALEPVEVASPGPGTLRVDFGQNFAGRVRVRVRAAAGREIVLRYAEVLNRDGSLHTANLLGARATDRYICRSDDDETFEPHFTFHGFRHVELSGDGGFELLAITGIVVHSDTASASDFACSSPALTKLYQNVRWSQRGNSLDVPTDCPQRAERLGWTGDIQVFARTATYNMDVAGFLTKYATDLLDAQFPSGPERGTFPWVAPSVVQRAGGPGWADAGVVVPWVVYERYGDVRVLERHYASLLAYADFLDRVHRGRVPGTFAGFGDWLSLDPEPIPVHDLGPEAVDAFGATPREFLRLAFAIRSTRQIARAARVLAREVDAARLDRQAAGFAAAFVDRYLADDRLVVGTQTALALALDFDLLPTPSSRCAAAANLVTELEATGHLRTGFLGTPSLLPALRRIGRTDLAYRLLERTEPPSWLAQVHNGATTVWERWDTLTQADGVRYDTMTSFNHYARGAVVEWIFSAVVGIDVDPAHPGYRRIRISPEPGGSLRWARAHVDTVRGRVSTSWTDLGDRIRLTVVIPPGTSAAARLPVRHAGDVLEGGIPLTDASGVTRVRRSGGRVECELAAGSYEFTLTRPLRCGEHG